MRICQFCSNTLETPHLASLGKGLAADGYSLLGASLIEPRAPVWLQQETASKYLCLNATARWQYPQAVLRLARWLRRERVDILHTHLMDAGAVGVLAARLAGVPLMIITRHHLDEPLLLGGRLPVEVDRWMARRADCVIVPAQAVRQHMMMQESLSDRHIEVVPYGFDFSLLQAAPGGRARVRAEFGLESDFVIGCVGRFFKNKGHYFLLKALKEILPAAPNVRLLLLGSGDRGLIEAGIQELGLTGRVIFAGFRQDVSACMSAMDLLVHPSLSECLPQVLIEAMSVGTPVIATTVGGTVEIITDGETGLLVPARDAESLAGAMLSLYRNEPLRQRLAAAGQRSVHARFTAEKMVARHLEIYRRYATRASNSESQAGRVSMKRQ